MGRIWCDVFGGCILRDVFGGAYFDLRADAFD